MIPRIQFRYIEGQDDGSAMPNHIFRETFFNPENFCSPVCCCCGIISVQTAVKSVFIISLVFSVWEISMGIWLLIASYYEIQMDPESTLTPDISIKQLHRLVAASWLIIGAGLFRLFGIIYLLYIVFNEHRRHKLPATFYISLSAVTGLILFYPIFIQIPGKGLILNEASNLYLFNSIYTILHCTDLLFMCTYSLYCVLYFAMVNSHERQWNLQRVRFENIDAEVGLM